MDDFLGTISSGWERFERELNRMDDWAARVIIVEGDYAGFNFTIGADGKPIPPYHRHYMLSPQFVEKRVAELTMRGVSIIFAGTADLSAGLATAIFRQRQQQLNKLNENELNKNRNTNDPQLQAGRNGRSQVR